VIFGNPVDFCKNRVMNARKGSVKDYKGLLDVIVRTIREEGVLTFYSGATSNFWRLVSWNMIMFMVYGSVSNSLKAHYNV